MIEISWQSTRKKSASTVGVVGGLGNVLWQICGAYACRPDEGHSLRFAAYDPAAKAAMDGFVKKERCVSAGNGCINPAGYWQNAKWLLPPDTIREHILRESVTEHACKEVDNFSLIVHVRGGDFLYSPAHRYSRIGQKYIDAAIDMLPGIKHCDVALVTDDLRYAREVFGNRYPVLGDNGDARVAFHTLCCAKNIVISPGSSFSWWAAYLGTHEHVFFPAQTWPQDIGALDRDITSCTSGIKLVPDSCKNSWLVIDGQN